MTTKDTKTCNHVIGYYSDGYDVWSFIYTSTEVQSITMALGLDCEIKRFKYCSDCGEEIK